jgi:multiple antibiotic resistance protein
MFSTFDPVDVARATFLIVATLFPIVNPLGGAPIFLSMAGGYPARVRNQLARRIALNSFILLIASLFIGAHVLAFFGLSLPAVQLAGGLVVASAGWALLNQPDRRNQDRETPAEVDILSHAFYPYTLPLTVGPGSISVAITLGAHLPKRFDTVSIFAPEAMVSSLVGAAAVSALIWLCYAMAERMSRALGPTGTRVLMRLSSFILFCIGVQIAWNGVQGLVKPLLGK